MKCTQAILLMEAERRGILPAPEKRRLRNHLRDCPECAAYQANRQTMADILRELQKPRQQEKG